MRIKTVSRQKAKDFDAAVNELLEKGWQLRGPMVVTRDSEDYRYNLGDKIKETEHYPRYAQQMIKYDSAHERMRDQSTGTLPPDS